MEPISRVIGMLMVEDAELIQCCEQIILLDSKMRDLQVRIQRAKQNRQRTFVYSYTFRMSILQGIRHMYVQYGDRKARRVIVLREEGQWNEEKGSSNGPFKGQLNLER
ncbi:hypothetical protein SNE40_005942 [Patella caerulea]|uniref:Uncharacterized protein n=1 Tax=Patella caerulea TaxID=87958 RepID=A0AAN8Q3X1_PATCE